MLDISAVAGSPPVPGRSCGSCTLCCKVFNVPEVESPAGKWCRHCAPGTGCTIHATRPDICRRFFCGWMVSPALGPEWKPERSKVILLLHAAGNGTFRLIAHVDESYPTAWRRADIYERLKRIATSGGPTAGGGLKVLVRVRIGRRHIVVLPDRDVDLGILDDDEDIDVKVSGMIVEVEKVRRAGGDGAAGATMGLPA